MHRHKFNGSNAEAFQIGKHGGMGQTAVRPAHFLGNLRVLHGQPFDMRFVDNRFLPWCSQELITLPIKEGVYDNRFRYKWGAVGVVWLSFGISK